MLQSGLRIIVVCVLVGERVAGAGDGEEEGDVRERLRDCCYARLPPNAAAFVSHFF